MFCSRGFFINKNERKVGKELRKRGRRGRREERAPLYSLSSVPCVSPLERERGRWGVERFVVIITNDRPHSDPKVSSERTFIRENTVVDS